MPRFRKKPVTVEAVQWTGDNVNELWDVFGAENIYGPTEKNPDWLIITTLEGDMRANVGDWIIRGVMGELYPCKPDVFAETYEPVEARGESLRQLIRDSLADLRALIEPVRSPAERRPIWDRRLEDLGEKARQALGIDGTMGDAQDVPHPYNDDEGAVPYCIVCGLAGSARAHKRLPEEGQG